jgi:hypothetical protein
MNDRPAMNLDGVKNSRNRLPVQLPFEKRKKAISPSILFLFIIILPMPDTA